MVHTTIGVRHKMETSGVNLLSLTIDDIVNAMRVHRIRTIDIDPKSDWDDISKPYRAAITDWFGSKVVIDEL